MFFDENHYFARALNEMKIAEMNDVLFDSELLGKLRLYNKSAGLLIDSPYLAEPNEKGFLYGMDLITRLEAKPKNGKRMKFKFYDLRNDEMLFGFSNVVLLHSSKGKGILIMEKCLGYFGKTRITVNELRFERSKV
jgi:hypothetical protein